jgi:hypothetical protein
MPLAALLAAPRAVLLRCRVDRPTAASLNRPPALAVTARPGSVRGRASTAPAGGGRAASLPPDGHPSQARRRAAPGRCSRSGPAWRCWAAGGRRRPGAVSAAPAAPRHHRLAPLPRLRRPPAPAAGAAAQPPMAQPPMARPPSSAAAACWPGSTPASRWARRAWLPAPAAAAAGRPAAGGQQARRRPLRRSLLPLATAAPAGSGAPPTPRGRLLVSLAAAAAGIGPASCCCWAWRRERQLAAASGPGAAGGLGCALPLRGRAGEAAAAPLAAAPAGAACLPVGLQAVLPRPCVARGEAVARRRRRSAPPARAAAAAPCSGPPARAAP